LVEAAIVAVAIGLNVGLPVGVIRFDLRRLDPERLARTWTDATILAACLAFGPLCLPVYFAKSRRSFVGFVIGVASAGGCLLASAVTVTALESLLTWIGWS